jgi:hypothetical protein
VIWLFLAVFLVLWVVFTYWTESGMLGFLFAFVVTLVIHMVYDANIEDGHAAQRKVEREARQAEESIPKVIREVDGCKVYSFIDHGGSGRRVYFTRCPESSATQSDYRSGKSTYTDVVPTTITK